jgi:hypothetical protein
MAKVLQAHKGGDEAFLRHVVGCVLISEHPVSDRVHHRLIPFHQERELVRIAIQALQDQIIFIGCRPFVHALPIRDEEPEGPIDFNDLSASGTAYRKSFSFLTIRRAKRRKVTE